MNAAEAMNRILSNNCANYVDDEGKYVDGDTNGMHFEFNLDLHCMRAVIIADRIDDVKDSKGEYDYTQYDIKSVTFK